MGTPDCLCLLTRDLLAPKRKLSEELIYSIPSYYYYDLRYVDYGLRTSTDYGVPYG